MLYRSTFGKDLVMISILTNKCIEIQDVVSDCKHKANTYTQMEDGNWKIEPNPDYVKLDLKAVYNTLLKNKLLRIGCRRTTSRASTFT